MKQVIALLIPILCVIGCVSSNQVTREWTLEKADQYAEINEQGKEHYATVTVQVDGVVIEYEGDYVTIRRDSVQWIEPGTQLARSVAIVNLRRIRFSDHGTGAGEGGIMGIVPGAIIFIIGAATDEGGSHVEGNAGKLVGLAVAIPGVVIGIVTGGIIGHKTDYIFPAP